MVSQSEKNLRPLVTLHKDTYHEQFLHIVEIEFIFNGLPVEFERLLYGDVERQRSTKKMMLDAVKGLPLTTIPPQPESIPPTLKPNRTPKEVLYWVTAVNPEGDGKDYRFPALHFMFHEIAHQRTRVRARCTTLKLTEHFERLLQDYGTPEAA